MNLVIKVTEGKVTDLVWDNQCYACETNGLCVDSLTVLNITNETITSPYTNCKTEICETGTEAELKCDPKFYITWFGTDADKRQLKSSNLAMSKFKQYSIGSLYNSAKDIFNKTVEGAKSTWDEVKKAAEEILK